MAGPGARCGGSGGHGRSMSLRPPSLTSVVPCAAAAPGPCRGPWGHSLSSPSLLEPCEGGAGAPDKVGHLPRGVPGVPRVPPDAAVPAGRALALGPGEGAAHPPDPPLPAGPPLQVGRGFRCHRHTWSGGTASHPAR